MRMQRAWPLGGNEGVGKLLYEKTGHDHSPRVATGKSQTGTAGGK